MQKKFNQKTGQFYQLSDPSGPQLNTPLGTEQMEGIKQFLKSAYESEPGQDFTKGLAQFGGFAKDFVDTAVGRPFDYLAQEATKLGAAKFYPTPSSKGVSALGAITPETPVSFTESINAGGGQTVYAPVTGGETFVPKKGFVPEMKRAGAQIGSVFDMMFGDARRAGERMNEGVDFEDLSPEERLGVRFFLLDILPIPGLGPAAKSAQATKAATQAQKQAMQKQITKGSVGAANTVEEMIEQTRKTLGPVSNEELQYLSNVFVNALPEQRLTIKSVLTNDEFNRLLDFSKAKLNVGSGVGDRKMAIIQQDGVPGIMYGRTKDKKRFVPLENLNLKMRPAGQTGAGSFQFTLKPGEKISTRTEAQKEGLLGGQQALRDIEAKENEIIKELYPKLKAQGLKMGLSDNPQPNTIFAIIRDRLGSDRVGNRLLSRSGLREKLKKLGLRDPADIADGQTQKDLIADVAKLTKDPAAEKGISNPLVRSLPPELEKLESFNKFLTLGVGVEDVTDLAKLTPDNPQLFNLLESYRAEAQEFLNTNPKFKNYFESLGETERIVLHKAHSDRTISPGDVSQNFQGLDATNVKILGRNVNVVLQPDLEVALLRNIKDQNVKGTKKIIGTMKDFFIGTKLNDPRRAGLTKEDYKWLEKNKIIDIPTITVGVGRPYKNTDAVIFGTEQQPNLAEIVAGELGARKYFNMKTNIEAETGGKLVETMKDGGYVGNMIPVKASVGKFIKGLFGETPAYRKEGMDVESLFGPTKKQKETLEKLYPGTAFPETYPGEVFYSNFDLALSRRGAPESFQNEDSFRNYMNQSGVGTDELDDAKVIPYIKSKSQAGEPIFSQDLRRIANQSPIRSVFMDAYGFRSDKINQASRDFFDPNTGSRVQIEGEAVYKDPAYPSTAIMDGALANSYRERVFRVKKDQLRGDPGSVPGGADNHKFGGSADTDGNYTLFWTRQTDRPAFIIPGEIVDKKTGEIIQPAMIADQTKLKGIEDRIQKLFADPIAKLDPQDLEGVSATVKRLVDSSAGRLTSGKAFNVVMGQIDAKQKQIKRLQNEYNAEKQRLDSFVSPQKKEIITTTIDELQSDILQSLRTKSRNIAGKLKIMADRNMSIDSMRDKELLEYFKETGGVVRPLGKTKEELIDQFNQLKEINQQLKASSQKFAFGITEGDLNYYNSVKQMQKKIMDEMTNNISKDLMQKLYPDVPLKDRVQYADAAVKQAVAEAAHRLFVEKDPNAPKYISYMSGSQIKSNYSQPGGAATPAAERAADLDNRQRMFEQSFAGGNEGAVLEQSELRGIGTEEFYGGPDVKNEQGAHFTGVMENIFKKVANEYGSKIEIANVATETPRVRDVYNIVDQDTGIVMGSGDTYRQAENIANDLVDKEGGRYRIATETERVYDSRPIFTMEITPEMLQLFKAYK